jgi:hypothetical protein
MCLSRSGPARQDLRTVSGLDGSSTKEFLLGVAVQPGLGNPMAISFVLGETGIVFWRKRRFYNLP